MLPIAKLEAIEAWKSRIRMGHHDSHVVIKKALAELRCLGPGYPVPIANAVDILNSFLHLP